MFRLYAKSSRLKSLHSQPTKIKTQSKYQEVTTIYTSDIYFSLTVVPHRSVAGVKSFLEKVFACIMANLTVLLHCRLVQQGNINISTLFGLLKLLFKRAPQSSNLKMGNDSHLGWRIEDTEIQQREGWILHTTALVPYMLETPTPLWEVPAQTLLKWVIITIMIINAGRYEQFPQKESLGWKKHANCLLHGFHGK